MLRLATLLANSIPDEDCDELFYEEITNAYDEYIEETGEYVGYGGSVREVRKKIKVANPDKLVRAVVNLLRRLDIVKTPKMWEQQQQEVFFQTKYDFRDQEKE